MTTTMRIDSETLLTIYKKWLTHCYPNSAAEKLRWIYEIERLNLSYGDGRDFDLFIWGSGGHIRQEYGKRYLEFFDERDATFFLLRWT